MQISHHHAQNVLVNGMPGTADNTMTPSGTAENGLLHSSESQDQFLINQKVQMLIKDAFGGNAAATTTLHRQVSGHEATLNDKFPTQNSQSHHNLNEHHHSSANLTFNQRNASSVTPKDILIENRHISTQNLPISGSALNFTT